MRKGTCRFVCIFPIRLKVFGLFLWFLFAVCLKCVGGLGEVLGLILVVKILTTWKRFAAQKGLCMSLCFLLFLFLN